MQDSSQNGYAMHKGIMLSGQDVDNAADSVPASDNMQYVNPPDLMRMCLVDALADFVQLNSFMPPDPSSPHTAPINTPQANSTPLTATLENK